MIRRPRNAPQAPPPLPARASPLPADPNQPWRHAERYSRIPFFCANPRKTAFRGVSTPMFRGCHRTERSGWTCSGERAAKQAVRCCFAADSRFSGPPAGTAPPVQVFGSTESVEDAACPPHAAESAQSRAVKPSRTVLSVKPVHFLSRGKRINGTTEVRFTPFPAIRRLKALAVRVSG